MATTVKVIGATHSQRRLTLSRCRALAVFLVFVLALQTLRAKTDSSIKRTKHMNNAELHRAFPLVWEHIHNDDGSKGSWYIPPEWLDANETSSQSIVEAAGLASRLAQSEGHRQVPFSKIPLIIHQRKGSSNVTSWDPKILPWVERWLQYATQTRPAIAYLFWTDESIEKFIKEEEEDLSLNEFKSFSQMEQTQIFRVLLLRKYGGIYTDIDTEPLHHPSSWIRATDTSSWTDPKTGMHFGVGVPKQYGDHARPVSLMVGLAADTNPKSNSYWRMGYTYPVQLAQWTFGGAAGHPVLDEFVDNVRTQAQDREKDTTSHLQSLKFPTKTGPAALTHAASTWLERTVTNFRWNAVTGLDDGGQSKVISDVLVLPMTAFSPGRNIGYGNMGSKPSTNRDARVYHHSLTPWRHFSLSKEYGKICRTLFRKCQDWEE